MTQTDLFGQQLEKSVMEFLPILPVSVVDIGAQNKRPKGGHDTKSSRSAFSGFPDEAVDLAYSLFLRDSRTVVDPFAGWGERGEGAKKYNKTYIGFDTSADSVESNALRGVIVQQRDSISAPIPSHDGLFTCPPYWNLERYAGDGLDRAKSWIEFKKRLDWVWQKCIGMMKVNGTAVVVVGDWRKDGIYYDLTAEVERSFSDLGLIPIDKVVLSRKTVTKIKIMIPQAVRMGYTVRCHETMLVYRKIDGAVEPIK